MKLKKFHLPIDPLRPHKRPVSVASPSIILDEAGNVKMIFGAAGGKQIATALSQVNKYRILHGGACGGAVGARVRALAGDIALCSWARHLTLTVFTARTLSRTARSGVERSNHEAMSFFVQDSILVRMT